MRQKAATLRIQTGGFTLIELLVVIAVITVLMGALLPALHLARQRAQAVVCRTHLRQWGTILSLYLVDNEGRFPRTSGLCPGLPLLRGIYIGHNIDPNARGRPQPIRTEKVACCPLATKTTGVGAFGSLYRGNVFMKVNQGGRGQPGGLAQVDARIQRLLTIMRCAGMMKGGVKGGLPEGRNGILRKTNRRW